MAGDSIIRELPCCFTDVRTILGSVYGRLTFAGVGPSFEKLGDRVVLPLFFSSFLQSFILILLTNFADKPQYLSGRCNDVHVIHTL